MVDVTHQEYTNRLSPDWMTSGSNYINDAIERSVLFLDVLRQRGNQQIEITSDPMAPVPNTVETIAPFVSQMQMDSEEHRAANGYQPLYVFHNRPQSGSQYAPSHQQLLPLDAAWKKSLEATRPWPNKVVPQVMGSSTTALRALLSEHLFISLFRACAESLASENASRLSAMDRADKNIQELLVTLNNTLHTQRQRAIDEELFDVISGYEALSSAAVKPDSF